MQRVVSIYLNGNVYQLEESGYNALFAYLDARDTQIEDDPDRAQKMADLEREVAEKCQACLTPTKSVVTSAEIERIIGEVGPIPAVETEPSPSSSGQGSTSNSSGATSSGAGGGAPFGHRRLYQIREGAMISGVCMGLSEYMHIDVTLLRILFVIFALVSAGWGILAYGVLMFLLPHVDTRAEATAGASGTLHWPWDNGWPWDRYGWPWDRYGWPWDHPTQAQQQARARDFGGPQATAATTPPTATPPPPPTPPTPSSDARQAWRDQRQAWRDQRQEWREQQREWRQQRRAAHAWPYGPGPIGGTVLMIVFLMIGFFWLSFWTRGNFFFGWPFFWGFPHWIGIVFFFMLLRVIFWPFRAARWNGYGYGPYPHPHYAWISMWNGLAWFLVIIFAVWFAYHYIPEVHDMIRGFQTSWTDSLHV